VAKKKTNTQNKIKKSKKGSKKSPQTNNNRRQKTAQLLSLSDSDYNELEESIKLSLKERDEAVDKIMDNTHKIKSPLPG